MVPSCARCRGGDNSNTYYLLTIRIADSSCSSTLATTAAGTQSIQIPDRRRITKPLGWLQLLFMPTLYSTEKSVFSRADTVSNLAELEGHTGHSTLYL